jgi:hypothetical protein
LFYGKIFRPSQNLSKIHFVFFQEMSLDTIDGLELHMIRQEASIIIQKWYVSGINHWGRLANSKWRLVPLEPETNSKIKLGFAPWSNFYQIIKRRNCTI